MSRWSWSILAVLVLGLAIYAFRPGGGPREVPAFVTPGVGTAYTLTAHGRVQVVGPTGLTINGLDRPLDDMASGRLWGTVAALRPDPQRIIMGVAESALAGYGLAGAAELTGSTPTGPVRLRWGRAGDQAYVWDGLSARLAAVDPPVVQALDQAAGRLDQRQALVVPTGLQRLTVDGLTLIQEGGWRAELARNRPPFDRRVEHLLRLLGAVQLTDLSAPPVALAPLLGRIDLGVGPEAVSVALYEDPQGVRIAIGRLPPQIQTDAAAWKLALAAFRDDLLWDATRAVGGRDRIARIDWLEEGAAPIALVRGAEAVKAGAHRWEVVWPDGREPAAPDAIQRMIDLLDTLAIDAPVLAAPPMGGSRAVITDERGDEWSLHQVGPQVFAGGHAGRLRDEGLLRRAFQPAHLLDPRLCFRAPSRISKIQRRHQGQAEVLTRAEGGTWRRTHPVPVTAVDGAAVDRLIRAIAAARGSTVTLARSQAERAEVAALLGGPTAQLALRFAPAEMGQAANDETDLDETAAQDWALLLTPAGGAWRATDADGGMLFDLDAETVESLFAPVDGGWFFPIVAASVTALEGVVGQDRWRIERQGAHWTVIQGQGTVDPVAVRRLLRTLATIPGRADRTIPEPASGDRELIAEVPALGGGRERLRLVVQADGRGWVGSDQARSSFVRGGATGIAVDIIPPLKSLVTIP